MAVHALMNMPNIGRSPNKFICAKAELIPVSKFCKISDKLEGGGI